MGVIDKLNENPKLGFGVGAATLIVALGIFAFQITGRGSGLEVATQAFYTNDDGKTFFKAGLDKIPPFDHKGKQAFRADVFKCADGHEFVGLVYRFTDSGRTEMATYIKEQPKDPEGALRLGIERRQMQVKKPKGDEKSWASIVDESYQDSLRAGMKCPEGKPAQLVVP